MIRTVIALLITTLAQIAGPHRTSGGFTAKAKVQFDLDCVAAGSCAHTGYGFQPDFVIHATVNSNALASVGTTIGSVVGVCPDVGVNYQYSSYFSAQNGGAPYTYTGRGGCMSGIMQGGPPVNSGADLTAWGADGFTTNETNGLAVYGLNMGLNVGMRGVSSSGLTPVNITVGQTGDVVVSGVGFKPDLLVLYESDAPSSFKISSIGFVSCFDLSQFTLITQNINSCCNASTLGQNSAWGEAAGVLNTGTWAADGLVRVSACGADGFTVHIDQATSGGFTQAILWQAIKSDAKWRVGHFAKSGTTGAQNVPTGITPSAVFLTGYSGSLSTQQIRFVGMVDKQISATQGLAALTYNASGGNGVNHSLSRTGAVIGQMDTTGTVTSLASGSLSGSTLALNWTTNDGLTPDVYFVAVGR